MAAEHTSELESLTHQLEELNRIGAALSAERDTARLLDLILRKAREITDSNAGSIYIVEAIPAPASTGSLLAKPSMADEPERPRRLRFTIAQNDSIDVPFREAVLEMTPRSIAGYVALTGKCVMLDDAYVVPEGAPYTFDAGFDRSDGYRTRSMLAVP